MLIILASISRNHFGFLITFLSFGFFSVYSFHATAVEYTAQLYSQRNSHGFDLGSLGSNE